MRQMLATILMAVMTFAPLMSANAAPTPTAHSGNTASTTQIIKHLVVIFQENVSFDHYFGTYPDALNPRGEPKFTPLLETPTVNGYTTALLKLNPNLNPANKTGATNPWRLDRTHTSRDQ